MERRPESSPAFYTVSDVAAITGLSKNSIRSAIKRGEIPGRQIGSRYSIPRRVFDGWWNQPFGEQSRTDRANAWQ